MTVSSASDSSPVVSPRGSDDSNHSHHKKPETCQEKQEAILVESGEDSPVVKAKKAKAPKKLKEPDPIEGK